MALAGEDVLELLKTDPEAAISVAVGLADRLRAANERMFEHALATVNGRVAATLLGQVEAARRERATATSRWWGAPWTSPAWPAPPGAGDARDVLAQRTGRHHHEARQDHRSLTPLP